MDLLVLADSTGAVDMTPEAISRRTNVPQPEVEKYIKDLCQPDARSRSDLHEGKRLIPLDDRRNWGWLIVNYSHYRTIKDEEARRTYFRNAQRQYRKEKKSVKDKGLTKFNTNGQSLTPSSASSSKRGSAEGETEFDRFWSAYPRKKSKGQAEKAWKQPHPDIEIILAAIAKAKQSEQWLRDGGQFVPYPATWLNAKGWEDEPTVKREIKPW